MKTICKKHALIYIYVIIFSFFIAVTFGANQAVHAFSQQNSLRHTIIIDAGHGGIDGGAVSCTGVYESHINLELALRLNDCMHLLGYNTILIRDTDKSVYTEGNTIAAKKVSDLKERIRIANSTPNAVYISIHQNHFSKPQYWGSQVFFNDNDGSKTFAELLQSNICNVLQPENKRQSKKVNGVYLMEHINCTGILLECGFLSNPLEETKLRDDNYQKMLCAVISAVSSQYLNT